MTTDSSAAITVVPMYSPTTVPILFPMPPEDLDREDATRTKTRMGAIALSAPMNRSPRISMKRSPGIRAARTVPTISPASMRRTMLWEHHLSYRLLIRVHPAHPS